MCKYQREGTKLFCGDGANVSPGLKWIKRRNFGWESHVTHIPVTKVQVHVVKFVKTVRGECRNRESKQVVAMKIFLPFISWSFQIYRSFCNSIKTCPRNSELYVSLSAAVVAKSHELLHFGSSYTINEIFRILSVVALKSFYSVLQ